MKGYTLEYKDLTRLSYIYIYIYTSKVFKQRKQLFGT